MGTRPPHLLLVLALVVFGCSDPHAPGRQSEFTVAVVSPNGPEGAVLLDVAAAQVIAVTSESAEVHTHVEGDRLMVVLVRAQPGELRAVVEVPDATRPPEVRLVQVAGPTNALRPLAGYSVEVKR
jgi:hypothetical protein